jgi:hypothetical protein
MRHLLISGLLLLPAACADQGSENDGEGSSVDEVLRFETPPVELQPGETAQFKTWVAGPVDRDRDILEITGWQGFAGHHAILMSSVEEQPIGTNRVWSEYDQLDTSFLGGVGGEGGAAINLPEGAVFRVPAGRSLVVQTHYQNASDQVIRDTFSYLDVKFSDPSDDRVVAGLFVNTAADLHVPAGQSTLDVSCTLDRDVPMLMWVNHIHEWGTDIKTTAVIDGKEVVLKDDKSWNPEWVTNPNYKDFSVDEPFVLPAGTTLTTHCAWNNSKGVELVFPEEMCIFTGHHNLGMRDVICMNGSVQN